MVSWRTTPKPCKTCHLDPCGRRNECPRLRKYIKQRAEARKALKADIVMDKFCESVFFGGLENYKREKRLKRKGA